MKAAVYTQYGAPEVLQLKQVTRPEPAAGEILIRVHATAVNSGDCRLRSADPFAVRFMMGLFRPSKTILGGVLSGEVVSVGEKATRFKVGDQVFGATMLRFGAYAEYICLPDTGALALKPSGLSHEEAAALPFGSITALHYLNQASIKPGQKVLVYGASGAVGSMAVQIAKSMGAEVTGVCSASNMTLVKQIGADHVIDYRSADFSQTGPYDVVYETVNKASVKACAAALKPGGVLMLGAAMLSEMLQGAWASRGGRFKLIAGMSKETPAAMQQVRDLVESGHLKPVIDRQYPLEAIAQAHAYVDMGHKKGSVVIEVA